MYVLVHHERVGPQVVHVHGGVERGVDGAEAPQQQRGARHQGDGVEDEVRHHDHVGRMAGDAARQPHVGPQHEAVEGGPEAARAVVDGEQHRRLELGGAWVPHGLERSHGARRRGIQAAARVVRGARGASFHVARQRLEHEAVGPRQRVVEHQRARHGLWPRAACVGLRTGGLRTGLASACRLVVLPLVPTVCEAAAWGW